MLAKAAGAEPSGQMRDQKLHAVVARSTFLHLLAGAIRSDVAQLDKKLARRWCGHMLQSGQIFQLHGQTLLSPGFHGFAALVFHVCHLCLPDSSHIFSLWDFC